MMYLRERTRDLHEAIEADVDLADRREAPLLAADLGAPGARDAFEALRRWIGESERTP